MFCSFLVRKSKNAGSFMYSWVALSFLQVVQLLIGACVSQVMLYKASFAKILADLHPMLQ